MTWHQGPSQGPSATTSTTRGQAARMAYAATTRGAACPRRVSVDKTWLKCSCGHNKTQTRLSWPWRVDWIHGARVSGGRRAWVSGDPAGLSQRRANGHWVRGGPAGLGERHPGNQRTSQRAWDSHSRRRISPAIGGHEGLPRETKHRNKTKTRKDKQNKTRWRGAAYG